MGSGKSERRVGCPKIWRLRLGEGFGEPLRSWRGVLRNDAF